MKKLFIIVLLLCSALLTAHAQDFKDYPARSTHTGKNAPVKLDSKEARMFRTQLRTWSKQKPNFAGRFIIATWGCGSLCTSFAIIDAQTGKVHFPGFYTCCYTFQSGWPDDTPPLEFSLSSRMLIVNGARNEKGNGTYFYEWKNSRLTLLRADEKP